MSPELQAINRLERRIIGLEKRITKQEEVWLSADKVRELYGYSAKSLQRMRKDGTLNHNEWRAAKGKKFQYLKSAIEDLYK